MLFRSIALLTGAIIGLLSGMIGIGGGIILSPLILLFHWADIKKTAAISALFIFVNSVAGIAGSFLQHFQFTGEMTTMLLVAITGAFAGSYLGAKKFENILLKRILAAVLLIASVKLIMT